MKIRKHGTEYDKTLKKDNSEKFECSNCGCEFTAKQDEYYVDYGGMDSNVSGTYYTYCTIYKRDYLICSCPECHKIVKKIREGINDNISVSYTTTATNTAPVDGAFCCE